MLGANGEHAGPGDLVDRAQGEGRGDRECCHGGGAAPARSAAPCGHGRQRLAAAHAARGCAADAGRQPGAHLGARRFRRGRGEEGAAARAQRHDLLRQRARARRGRSEARGARARAARHGARLRHRHHRRRAAGLRQRGAARRCRHHRRIGHRHPGGVVPARQRGTRHLACDRHGRARSLGGGRRHHHADGDRSARPRSRNARTWC